MLLLYLRHRKPLQTLQTQSLPSVRMISKEVLVWRSVCRLSALLRVLSGAEESAFTWLPLRVPGPLR